MKLGKILKQIIKSKTMSQADLCKIVGITQSYLSLLETDKRSPVLLLLYKIADKLETPLSLIFWLAMERDDIKDSKKEAFDIIKPIADKLISEIIN